ncbi:MAG TPA: ABC transporter permease [Thermomicrobiales bacterium]|nr:ABC transporter permease [Thermomicrobiales bacterium]
MTPDVIGETWTFIRDNQERFNSLLLAHIRISGMALLLAMTLYLPLGVLLAQSTRLGSSVAGVLSAVRVIPSLALVFIFVPWLGFGYRPALLALVLLAAPPLLINTLTGLRQVDPAVIDAARGMGMTRMGVLTRVQVPLAVPLLLAGIRTAAVEIVASATLASMIGVKTLGQFIFTGISLLDPVYLLAGGIPIVLLVLAIEVVFGGIEWLAKPGHASGQPAIKLVESNLTQGATAA